MMITALIDEASVIRQIPLSNVINILGLNQVAAYRPEALCQYLPNNVIDAEYRRRHPNPSEMLDVMDDEIIIDYLLNKGYNIEM